MEAEPRPMEEEGGLIALAIRRPVAMVVMVLLLFFAGVLAVREMPIQLTPDLDQPTLTVTTAWPGATPEEVEAQIVDEQEAVLKSLPGLERMTSESAAGQGTINLEFRVGTSIQEALVRATNQLSQVPDYPDTADQPVVNTGSSAGPPLAVVLLQSKDQGPVAGFRTWAEEELVSRIQRVPGVASVTYFGGRDQQVAIEARPEALAGKGLTLSALARGLQGELRDISGGEMIMGKRRYPVRTAAQPRQPSDLALLTLPGPRGPVRLGDVATVAWAQARPTAYVIGNGHEALAMLLQREAGTNVLDVTEEVKGVVGRLQAEKLDALGLELRVVGDQTGYIRGALRNVQEDMALGGALALVVLVAFLRSFGASATITTTIPICAVGAALGMSAMGRSLNVVSLAGVAFAIGMVIDNAIVVLENIDTWRHRLRGQPEASARAALLGTREVWGALLASTATMVVVFVPIIRWQDEVGLLLRDVAIAMTWTSLVSLFASVLVVPSLAARIGPLPDSAEVEGRTRRLARRVGAQVSWACRGWRPFVLPAAVVALCAALTWGLWPKMEYLPTGNRNFLFGQVVPPPGYSIEEMARIGQGVQDRIVPHLGADPAREASTGVPGVGRTFFAARTTQGFMGAEAVDPDRIGDLVGYVRGVMAGVPATISFVTQASLFGRNTGGSRVIDVDIAGSDLATMARAGGQLMGALGQALPGAQIRPVPSLDAGAPEIRVLPRREEAAALGLSPAELGLAVDALVDGRKIGEWGPPGAQQVDVVLRSRWAEIIPADSPLQAAIPGSRSPAELSGSPIATPDGRLVPLASVAEVVESLAPSVVQRIERRRAITLRISPVETMPLEEGIDIIQEQVIPKLELPEGVELQVSGAAGKLEVAQGRLGGVLLAAVLVCYLVMAALYEDFLAPLVILITMPMAAAGGVLGLWAVHHLIATQALDMMTAMGFLILIGVVVNNAILVVDVALERLKAGDDLPTACAAGVESRVRPILISAFTSLLGMLPLVVTPGAGSELYRGVGAVVLGGMALSTVLTIYIVPSLFCLVWRWRR